MAIWNAQRQQGIILFMLNDGRRATFQHSDVLQDRANHEPKSYDWFVSQAAVRINPTFSMQKLYKLLGHHQIWTWLVLSILKEHMQEWVNENMECCLVMQLADDANSECCTTCSDQAAVEILNANSLVSHAVVADATHLQLATWLHDAILSAAHFGQLNRPFYTPTLLHTNPFTHRRFYTQMLWCKDASTQQRSYTQMPFTHKPFYTHRRFYTQTLLRKNAFTHRCFYTQMPLHT